MREATFRPGFSLLIAMLLLLALATASQVGAAERGHQRSRGTLEAQAGTWRPWLLTSGGQFRLPPPPDQLATRAELHELESLAGQRDAAALDRIRFWDAGSPGLRWNELAISHAQNKGRVGNRAARMMALLNVAIADGMIAAWDTKYTYKRPRPTEVRPSFQPVLATPNSPAYPSEHAVAAGAAETVLSYLFPEDRGLFATQAQEAANSRLLAGTDYPSDIEQGLALGRQIGALAVEWGRGDGADLVREPVVLPTGPGLWSAAPNLPPVEPYAGLWKPWLMRSGDQFRPGPRAAYDSPALRAELDEVKNYPRTNLTNLTAAYWEYYGFRGNFEYWNLSATRRLYDDRLDGNAPRAARVYALLSVAHHDAHIACWDAKYTYWAARPAQLDPAITPLFVTPNHPSYPSGHGCLSAAATTVLTDLFPREGQRYQALLAEINLARIQGGIHVRSDQVAGEAIGRGVAGLAIARARSDGAD